MRAAADTTKMGLEGHEGAMGRAASALLAAFVFTIPFEEIVTIPGVGSFTRLIGFGVVVVGLAALVRRDRLVLRAPMAFYVVTLTFVLWNLATFYWSYDPLATLSQFITYGQLFAFVWLLGEHARTETRLAALMQAFVLGNYVVLALTVRAVIIQPNPFRELGRFNANEVSIVAALAIPMAMLLLEAPTRPVWRWINAAYPVAALAIIILAASRGGLIVGLIALAAVPLAFVRGSVGVRIAFFAMLVAVATVGFEVVPRAFPQLDRNVERLAGTGDELAEGTLTGRTVIWGATLTLFMDSPWIGVGAGAPRYALVETNLDRSVAVHNVYLSVAAGGGLVAIALFGAMLAFAGLGALWSSGHTRPYLVVLTAALVVALVPANVEASKFTWFILALLACSRPIVLMPSTHIGHGPR